MTGKGWFVEMLREALAARGGVVTRLVADIGMPRGTVRNWLNGTEPGHASAVAVAARLGYIVPDLGDPTEKPVSGRVTAGSVDLAVEDGGTVAVPDDVWHGSAFWSLTHGIVLLLRVQGDSMSPRYKNGDIIACRAPSITPPAGTPVILRDGNGFTFKLFSMSHDKRHVVGLPLNPAYPPVVLPARETTQVQYVVLGALNLGR